MKKGVLFEDATMASNRWTQGISSRELTSNKVTLSDLFFKFNKQFPNDAKAEASRPHTLDNIVALLGTIITGTDNVREKVRLTKNTPFSKKSKEKQELLDNILNKTDNIDKLVQQIADDLDKLVDVPKSDSNILKSEID